MGTCYTLILLDEFNWGYKDTDKQENIDKFKQAYGSKCFEVVGQWYGGFAVDVDKAYPLMPERLVAIKKYSDAAYYIADNQLTAIVRIE